MIGVQKAQISKLERNANNLAVDTIQTVDTIQKVFKALKTKIKFPIEINNTK